MLELKTPKERASVAFKMAGSLNLVRYRNTTYTPAHWVTGDTAVPPAPEETIWIPLSRDGLRRIAAEQYDMLFATDGELSGFDFMVAQNCWQQDHTITSLLVRTEQGLRQLTEEGQLLEVDGSFHPNTLSPMLNTDPEAKAAVWGVLNEWVGGEEEATSLVRHLATSLAPGWSAVKYVLLLGEGRNGKSLLMRMVQELFGVHNTSSVTRQAISEKSPSVLDLNGKLVNLVFDGAAEYLKDSGAEKTLIAGEPFPIRKLYESTATSVQTNALFVEGLNKEPKSVDKSAALQKRLVRFLFSNTYPLNRKFERHVLSEEMLGAFLSILVDNYVLEEELAEALAPTQQAIQLQLEHMFVNSAAWQFLKYLETEDALGANGLLGEEIDKIAQQFMSWRIKENDLSHWSEPDAINQLLPLVNTERKSRRVNGSPRKVRVVKSFKPEALGFLESLKGEEDVDTAAVVED